MSRKKLIAANWKMHKSIADAESFCSGLKAGLGDLPACDLALFPAFFAVPATAAVVRDTDVAVGAQDLYWEKQGAFTGEISAAMIADAGGTHVLVGHSERRHVLGESNEVVAKKLHAAINGGLTAVFCVGERLEDRDSGGAERYVAEQIDTGLSAITADALASVVVAYEPVWAIGTGRTATPEDAQSMHRFVRDDVSGRFGAEAAARLRILYGGSVKPENAAGLLVRDDIDGALIGGASLDVSSFLDIARAGAQR